MATFLGKAILLDDDEMLQTEMVAVTNNPPPNAGLNETSSTAGEDRNRTILVASTNSSGDTVIEALPVYFDDSFPFTATKRDETPDDDPRSGAFQAAVYNGTLSETGQTVITDVFGTEHTTNYRMEEVLGTAEGYTKVTLSRRLVEAYDYGHASSDTTKGNWWIAGQLTPNTSMQNLGTATYRGVTRGTAYRKTPDSPEQPNYYGFRGNMELTADFGNKSFHGKFDNFTYKPDGINSNQPYTPDQAYQPALPSIVLFSGSIFSDRLEVLSAGGRRLGSSDYITAIGQTTTTSKDPNFVTIENRAGIRGFFFGENANETAGSWQGQTYNPSENWRDFYQGVFIGKQN